MDLECEDLERRFAHNSLPTGRSWAKEMLLNFRRGFLCLGNGTYPGRLQRKEKNLQLKPVASYGRPRTSAGWGVTYRRLHEADKPLPDRSARRVEIWAGERTVGGTYVCVRCLLSCVRIGFYCRNVTVLPMTLWYICRRSYLIDQHHEGSFCFHNSVNVTKNDVDLIVGLCLLAQRVQSAYPLLCRAFCRLL